jgi:hypothetical protein
MVQHSGGFWVRRVVKLKPAVKGETINPVGAHPPADVVTGFEY